MCPSTNSLRCNVSMHTAYYMGIWGKISWFTINDFVRALLFNFDDWLVIEHVCHFCRFCMRIQRWQPRIDQIHEKRFDRTMDTIFNIEKLWLSFYLSFPCECSEANWQRRTEMKWNAWRIKINEGSWVVFRFEYSSSAKANKSFQFILIDYLYVKQRKVVCKI